MKSLLLFVPLLLLSCKNKPLPTAADSFAVPAKSLGLRTTERTDSASWPFFLQHLPQANGTVVDYRGQAMPDQAKAFAVLPYDVGSRDLQQCADALMRLRAEYLFAQKRFAEISFRFTSGEAYAYTDYLRGRTPVAVGNGVRFSSGAARQNNAVSLRHYLDYVYTYAGTLSLAAELKTADDFAIGTVVIKPGSPGHCFIIVDEATAPNGERLYKLVEGYTPAQTLYVLRNDAEPALGCWHRLKKGQAIETASYLFSRYQLKTFE